MSNIVLLSNFIAILTRTELYFLVYVLNTCSLESILNELNSFENIENAEK